MVEIDALRVPALSASSPVRARKGDGLQRKSPRRALSNKEFAVTVLALVLISAVIAAVLAALGIPYQVYVVVALAITAATLAVIARGRRQS